MEKGPTIRFGAYAVLLLLLSATFARADLILTYWGFYARYSESTGAFIRESNAPTESLSGPVVGPDGNVYAAGNAVGDGAILRFRETAPQTNEVFVPYSSAGFTIPFGMAFGTNGNIFAGSITFSNHTEIGPGRILQFSGSTGEFIGELFPARFNFLPEPNGIAVGPDGWIYVTDSEVGVSRFPPIGLGREVLATNIAG